MALMNQMFMEMPPDEREAALRDTCDNVKNNYEYTKFLSEEDLAQRRERKVLLDIQISKDQEELKAYVQAEKERMKPFIEQQLGLLVAVRDRVERAKETVYIYRDESSRMLGYYTTSGELVFSRRMTPEEVQGSILSEIRISSEGSEA